MQSPFSVYASAFLSRSSALKNPAASTSSDAASSAQPLFYSATAGDSDNEDDPFRTLGMGLADSGVQTPGSRSVVDEDGVPRLAGSRVQSTPQSDDPYLDELEIEGYEENPHLQLEQQQPTPSSAYVTALSHSRTDMDEEVDAELEAFKNNEIEVETMPMMDSLGMLDAYDTEDRPPSSVQYSRERTLSTGGAGWRTHISVMQPPLSRSTSLSRSRSPSIVASEDDEEASLPPSPSYLLSTTASHYPDQSHPAPPPPTHINTMSVNDMTESLLPHDGITRSLFHLPDPDRPVPQSKHFDAPWMTAWLGAVSLCGVGSVLIFFLTNSSPKAPSDSPHSPIPYSTLTHTIPLLTMLTLTSSAASYGYLILFRFAVRPMLILTALSTPLFLFLSSAYAFSGSFFSSEAGTPGSWSETIGLRLFSIVPLIFAYLSGKSFYARYESLLQTASVIELSTSLLITHPSILALSLAILLSSLVASVPFLSLTLRLLLIGYWSHADSSSVWEWHVRNWAGTLATAVVIVWLWSWGVARGIMRVVVGGVMGNWYFTANDPAYTLISQQQATRAAFSRATGPSLGSICAGSLTLNSSHAAIVIMRYLRRLTTPPQLLFLAPLHPLAFLSNLIGVLDSMSQYALVYIGITGEAFWPSARRVRAFMENRLGLEEEEENGGSASRRRRRLRGRGRRVGDYTFVSHLLTLAALSISVFSAIGGFIFAAHTLEGPTNAPLAALTCGGVTFLTVRFGLGLGEDAADALYLCYNIDIQAGTKHRMEVFEAFEGRQPQGPMAA